MRKIIIFIFLSFISKVFTIELDYRLDYDRYSNNTYNDTTMVSHDVSSDFGWRYRKSNGVWSYGWHKGVDFAFPRHSRLKSLNSGRIEKIYSFGSGFKYIVIADNIDCDIFGYAHIFDDTNISEGQSVSKDFIMTELNGDPATLVIVIVNTDNPRESTVICSELGIVTFTYNDTSYTINHHNNERWKTEVTEGDIIAPVGGSGGFSAFPHLHLYQFINTTVNSTIPSSSPSNCVDPLGVITHNIPSYDILIDSVHVVYGENNSSVRVRCALGDEDINLDVNRYDSAVMDINKVKLRVQNSLSNEESILMGGYYSEGALISHGGTLFDSTPYPTNVRERVGNFEDTGIVPHAYSDLLGFPYDYFYFSDFLLRISRNDTIGVPYDYAEINYDARYPDGKYKLWADLETVSGLEFEQSLMDETEIVIDNFMPFIDSVNISKNGNQENVFLDSKWSWNSEIDSLVFAPSGDSIVSPGHDLCFKVRTSEPMNYLSIDSVFVTYQLVDTLYATERHAFNADLSPLNIDFTKWEVVLEWNDLDDLTDRRGLYQFSFNGRDLSGHNLLQMDSDKYHSSQIPIHQEDNSWAPDTTNIIGNDSNYGIVIMPDGNDTPENATTIYPNRNSYELDSSNDVDWYLIEGINDDSRWYFYTQTNQRSSIEISLFKCNLDNQGEVDPHNIINESQVSSDAYSYDHILIDTDNSAILVLDNSTLLEDQRFLVKIEDPLHQVTDYELFLHSPPIVEITYPQDNMNGILEAETNFDLRFNNLLDFDDLLNCTITADGYNYNSDIFYDETGDDLNFTNLDYNDDDSTLVSNIPIELYPWQTDYTVRIEDKYNAYCEYKIDSLVVAIPTPTFNPPSGEYDYLPYGLTREDGISIFVRDGSNEGLRNNYDLNSHKYYITSDNPNYDDYLFPENYDSDSLNVDYLFNQAIPINKSTEIKTRAYSLDFGGRSSKLETATYTFKAKTPKLTVKLSSGENIILDSSDPVFEYDENVNVSLCFDSTAYDTTNLAIAYVFQDSDQSLPYEYNTSMDNLAKDFEVTHSQKIIVRVYQKDSPIFELEPSDILVFDIKINPTLSPPPGWYLNAQEVRMRMPNDNTDVYYTIGDEGFPEVFDGNNLNDFNNVFQYSESNPILIDKCYQNNEGGILLNVLPVYNNSVDLSNTITYRYNIGSDNLTGNISGSLSLSGSPYTILDSLIVPKDSILTIDPGVHIHLKRNDSRIKIYGRINAIGSSENFIKFTPDSTDWKGILIVGDSLEYENLSCSEYDFYNANEFDSIRSYFSFCEINKAKYGIKIIWKAADIVNSKILSCNRGIYTDQSQTNIIGNLINENTRGIITKGDCFKTIIQNNTLIDNYYAIFDYDTRLSVANCLFYSNVISVCSCVSKKFDRTVQLLNCYTTNGYSGALVKLTNEATPPIYSYDQMYCIEKKEHNRDYWHHDYWKSRSVLKLRNCLTGESGINITNYSLNNNSECINKGRQQTPGRLSYSLKSLKFNRFWHWLWNSKLRHKYHPTAFYFPELDLAGNQRKVGTIDIGAYEYQNQVETIILPKTITSNTTWDAENIVFSGSGDLLISSEGSLTISPNCNIKFQSDDMRIVVEGQLIIDGYEDNPIELKPDGVSNWKGIVFMNTPNDKPSKIKNCIIKDVVNLADTTANNIGGAITVVNSDSVTIENCEILNCLTQESGSAISIDNSNCFIINNNIHDNTANLNGGAICINEGAPKIVGNKFHNNSSLMEGGAIYSINSNPQLINNLIHNNIAGNAGAVSITNSISNLLFVNNTIVENRSNSSGGAIIVNSGDIEMVNSIIWNNRESFSDSVGVLNNIRITSNLADVSLINCNLNNKLETVFYDGNLNDVLVHENVYDFDPYFVDPETSDYSLKSYSELINKGNNESIENNEIELDIKGKNRIKSFNVHNGVKIEAVVDIGAFEYQSNPISHTSISAIGNNSEDPYDFGEVFVKPEVGYLDSILITITNSGNNYLQDGMLIIDSLMLVSDTLRHLRQFQIILPDSTGNYNRVFNNDYIVDDISQNNPSVIARTRNSKNKSNEISDKTKSNIEKTYIENDNSYSNMKSTLRFSKNIENKVSSAVFKPTQKIKEVSTTGSLGIRVKPEDEDDNFTFMIVFDPDTYGDFECQLQIYTNDPDDSLIVKDIKGTGLSPEINLLTTDYEDLPFDYFDFGDFYANNEPTDPKEFILQNIGSYSMEIDSIVVPVGFEITLVDTLPNRILNNDLIAKSNTEMKKSLTRSRKVRKSKIRNSKESQVIQSSYSNKSKKTTVRDTLVWSRKITSFDLSCYKERNLKIRFRPYLIQEYDSCFVKIYSDDITNNNGEPVWDSVEVVTAFPLLGTGRELRIPGDKPGSIDSNELWVCPEIHILDDINVTTDGILKVRKHTALDAQQVSVLVSEGKTISINGIIGIDGEKQDNIGIRGFDNAKWNGFILNHTYSINDSSYIRNALISDCSNAIREKKSTSLSKSQTRNSKNVRSRIEVSAIKLITDVKFELSGVEFSNNDIGLNICADNTDLNIESCNFNNQSISGIECSNKSRIYGENIEFSNNNIAMHVKHPDYYPKFDMFEPFVCEDESIIEIEGDILSRSSRWIPFDGSYIITDSLTVCDSVCLNINKNNRIKFYPNISLINEGQLNVNGKLDSLVVFKSISSPSSAWKGIEFNTNKTSYFEYCVFTDCNDYTNQNRVNDNNSKSKSKSDLSLNREIIAAINITNSDSIIIKNSIFENNQNGIYNGFDNSIIDLQDSEFIDNQFSAIYSDANMKIDGSNILMTALSSSDSLIIYVTAPDNYPEFSEIHPINKNSIGNIKVLGGIQSLDKTWIEIPDKHLVLQSILINNGCNLTIRNDNTVEFFNESGLEVEGSIDFIGIEDKTILLTSPEGYYWSGIKLNTEEDNTLTYCVIEKCKTTQSKESKSNSHSRIRDGKRKKIYRNETSGLKILSSGFLNCNNTVFINNDIGLLNENNSVQVNLQNTKFIRNDYYGISLLQNMDVFGNDIYFEPSSVSDSLIMFVALPDYYPEFDDESPINVGTKGNVKIIGGNQNITRRWVTFPDKYLIWSNISIENNTGLRVEEGNRLIFCNNSGMSINGYLNFQGSDDMPIILTSPDSTTWTGLNLFNNFSDDSTIENCYFSKASKQTDGGAIFINGYDMISISDCKFFDNYSGSNGGAIYAENSDVDITNSAFLSNYSGGNGGALYLIDGSPNVCFNRFEQNESLVNGGAIYSINQVTQRDSRKRNTSRLRNSKTAKSEQKSGLRSSYIRNNFIQHNKSAQGGGIYLKNKDLLIKNNVIALNTAIEGGGLFLDESNPTILNNTIVDNNNFLNENFVYGTIPNISQYIGGGIYHQNSSPIIKNNIIWENLSSDSSQMRMDELSEPDISYCNIQNYTEDLSRKVISLDPLFSEEDTLHFYNLGRKSLCINYGYTESNYNPNEYDVRGEGNPRVVHTYQHGDTVVDHGTALIDLGAYEFHGDYIEFDHLEIDDRVISYSPCHVRSSFEIAENQKLTINPGVKMQFTGDHQITMKGVLKANGLENDNISFMPLLETSHWDGIYFDIDNINDSPQVSSFKYCNFQKSIANNLNDLYGGAIYLNSWCEIIIEDCTFSQCSSEMDGGAIYLNNCNQSIIRSLFANNSSVKGYGGAVSSDSSNILIDDCEFNGNMTIEESGKCGGAISIYSSLSGSRTNSLIKNSNFIANEANSFGGSIFIDKTNPVIELNNFGLSSSSGFDPYKPSSSSFYSPNGGGGAVFIQNSSAIISENHFLNSNSINGGAIGGRSYGGIEGESLNPQIINNSFEYCFAEPVVDSLNNKSFGFGGAIFLYDINTVIENNFFEFDGISNLDEVTTRNNKGTRKNRFEPMTEKGGAIALFNMDFKGSRIVNNRIFGCYASKYGGGIYSKNSNLDIVNNLLVDNESYTGGGACIIDSTTIPNSDISLLMVNNTLTENNAQIGNEFCVNNINFNLLNSIIYRANPDSNQVFSIIGDYSGATDTCRVENCFISGGQYTLNPTITISDSNFYQDEDAKFSMSSNYNYELGSSSLCIGAGNNDFVPTYLDYDLKGNDRIGTDGFVEIGAYEFYGDETISSDIMQSVVFDKNISIDGNISVFRDAVVEFADSIVVSFSDNSSIEFRDNSSLVVGDSVTFRSYELLDNNGLYLNSTATTISNATFDNCNISAKTPEVILANNTLNNSRVVYGGPWMEIHYCIFNSGTVRAFGQSDPRFDGNIQIENCIFRNNTSSTAISINSYPHFLIYENQIEGYRTGLMITESGFGKKNAVADNLITLNQYGMGIEIYHSYVSIQGANNIYYNMYGVAGQRNSMVKIVGNSQEPYQQIFNNYNTEVAFRHDSFPTDFMFNLIYDTIHNDYYLVECTDHNVLGSSPHQINVNYWGTNYQNDDFYPVGGFFLDQPWTPGNVNAVHLPPDQELYKLAEYNMSIDNLGNAEDLLKQLVTDYPKSKYADDAIKTLMKLYNMKKDSFYILKGYFEQEPNLYLDSEISKLTDYLINYCKIKYGDYQGAIEWYENLLDNQPSMEDSLYAMIDLGYIYLLMEEDGQRDYVGRYPQHKPSDLRSYEEMRSDLIMQLVDLKFENPDIEPYSAKIKLDQNYPNPFVTSGINRSKGTRISFSIPDNGDVKIDIFNLKGQKVKTLLQENLSKGNHYLTWNGKTKEEQPAGSGVYFYRLTHNNKKSDVKKMILVK